MSATSQNAPAKDQLDDAAFIGFVNQIICGAVVRHQPKEVCIFKIDHWFDHKWLAFSGKTLGALGVWNTKRLTVPPFVSNRIISQWHYEREPATGNYQITTPRPDIHYQGWAANNLNRLIERIIPNTALFWYSGDTAAMGRGSLMGYIPIEDSIWPWFISFVRDDEWRIARRKSIHEYEVRSFQSAADGSLVMAGQID